MKLSPKPPRSCPICRVAMQATRNAGATTHKCERCGTVVTVADRDGAKTQS